MDQSRTFTDGEGVEITLERDRIIRAIATAGSPYISVDYKPHIWAASEGDDPAPATAGILADIDDFESWSGIQVSQLTVISSGAEQVIIGGEDFTITDKNARLIIDRLATTYGITEAMWARMPQREQANWLLKAQLDEEAAIDLSKLDGNPDGEREYAEMDVAKL